LQIAPTIELRGAMLSDLAVRFIVGGTFVSLFSAAGEIWKPKTFAGLWGAAPSVAIGSLLFAFVKQGAATATIEAHAMSIGCAALIIYSCYTVFITQRESVPVWLGAASGWLVWFAAAAVSYVTIREIFPR
jgi:hypothetical protein